MMMRKEPVFFLGQFLLIFPGENLALALAETFLQPPIEADREISLT